MNLKYTKLSEKDYNMIVKLCIEVFMQYEAPQYTNEGVESFSAFINGTEFRDCLESKDNLFFGCFYRAKLVGVIGMRNAHHITVCFVDSIFQRKGIGRTLMKYLTDECTARQVKYITVNSSPFGVPFYHSMGFCDTDCEKTDSGIIFTPMKKQLNT